ncbi:hypothetical protein SAMN02745244_02886 [Tessaracoccus bendigoensis DSM 12906]|uniref:Uncharacterized protein n=1 Tax=Tessaracoccus bendigoensis DSM 12906 TaxID=1123357 RepID=A0A1M6KQJ2_9ACTN|nr:hypothetical protein [Tessaracoccus bendigoensis]SHJ61181.1 hypothetical protein SAMN02745244_02886 [Tessaracoccus bendigoensis DSM 12906]
MKKIRISPSHASVPEALAPFLAAPDRPVPYRWWTRLSDRWAGRRDRVASRHQPTPEVAEADTPWLRRLIADCNNAVATGRVRTEALVSILDRERATLLGEIDQAKLAIADLTADLSHLDAVPITGDAVGPGEMYSSSEERLRRRRHERNQRSGRLNGLLGAARARLADAHKRVEIIEQERKSHWVVLQERTRVLTEYHQRRAATYTGALENRRSGQFWAVPQLEIPDWARADLGTGGRDGDAVAPILTLTGTN